MQDKQKFSGAERNFKTRAEFISLLFTETYTQTQIMANCIQYKLGKSFETYAHDVERSLWTLCGEDPIKILKRIDVD